MIQIFEKQDDKYIEIPWGSFLTFPGGEIHCRIDNLPAHCHILARIRNWEDFGQLITLTNAIKNLHKVLEQKTSIHLHIPYFPGARQDRIANLGEPFTVKVYADLINTQNYDSVEIVDPHSDVVTALIDNVKVLEISPILRKLVDENGYNTIIIPDAGAAKKTFSYYFPESSGLRFIQCLKKRDTTTGKLSGFKILDRISNIDSKCLLVDDICDGGGTFVGLAKEFHTQFKLDLSLYVTHGIFSKGLFDLCDMFSDVYTLDSFYSLEEYTEQHGSIHNKSLDGGNFHVIKAVLY